MIPRALMHKFFTRLTTVAMLTIALSGTEIRADRTKLDPSTGLIVTGDWELVRDNCTVCHAAKLITQRRGSAAEWSARGHAKLPHCSF